MTIRHLTETCNFHCVSKWAVFLAVFIAAFLLAHYSLKVYPTDIICATIKAEDLKAYRRLTGQEADRITQQHHRYRIGCSTAIKIRIDANSGHWICNPWRFKRNCQVAVISDDTSEFLEKDLLIATSCKVHLFTYKDPQPKGSSIPPVTSNGRTITHRLDETRADSSFKSINSQFQLEQHRSKNEKSGGTVLLVATSNALQITEILKWLEDGGSDSTNNSSSKFCQIVLSFSHNTSLDTIKLREAVNIGKRMRDIASNNYVQFHSDSIQALSEDVLQIHHSLSLINRDCLRQFRLHERDIVTF